MRYNSKLTKKFLVVFIILINIVVIAPDICSASVTSLLEEAGKSASYETTNNDPAALVGSIINVFISLLGIIFIILMIYGGYLWMVDRGNEEQVKKAKDLIRDAIIGLIIVVASYAITYFVLASISKDYIKSTGF